MPAQSSIGKSRVLLRYPWERSVVLPLLRNNCPSSSNKLTETKSPLRNTDGNGAANAVATRGQRNNFLSAQMKEHEIDSAVIFLGFMCNPVPTHLPGGDFLESKSRYLEMSAVFCNSHKVHHISPLLQLALCWRVRPWAGARASTGQLPSGCRPMCERSGPRNTAFLISTARALITPWTRSASVWA